MKESIRAKLLKIHALAESGLAGERENAAALLRRLAEENGIRIEDLLTAERSLHVFWLRGAWDLKILVQVACAVCQRNDIRSRKANRHVGLFLTPSEAVDVRSAYTHYRAAFAKDVEELFRAFVHRHDIFGPPSGSEKSMSEAELNRMLAMIRGISSESWRRPAAQIEEARVA